MASLTQISVNHSDEMLFEANIYFFYSPQIVRKIQVGGRVLKIKIYFKLKLAFFSKIFYCSLIIKKKAFVQTIPFSVSLIEKWIVSNNMLGTINKNVRFYPFLSTKPTSNLLIYPLLTPTSKGHTSQLQSL